MPTPRQRQLSARQLQERREVGDRIRYLRRQQRISQERLAELIGRDRQTVGNYESGRTPPSLDDLIAIAQCLDVSTWRLFHG
ncbi:helix-turn-helix domain-containing protein [Kitasatospora sp. NPDC058478]|uniref:helix-turn-helix domain-containing protein n=1 Tax=unclassified Kitasatospora TaxID=2633591 RepID=UPI00365F2823